ncbi:unnamed protein product, partial [Polarella glacialis]
ASAGPKGIDFWLRESAARGDGSRSARGLSDATAQSLLRGGRELLLPGLRRGFGFSAKGHQRSSSAP